MKNIEKTLLYYELLMIYNDTSNYLQYELPNGYHYEFYKNGDEDAWVKIHISSMEFGSYKKGLEYFHDFYDDFINELPKRCIFIVDDNTGEKIGTATISPLKNKEYGYDAAVDWVAIKKEHQRFGLSKPLISRFIKLANELGHEKLILHTQTHTWLAAKIYLDVGFIPFKVEDSLLGWQILKTITNSKILNNIDKIPYNSMFSDTAIKIYNKLEKSFNDDFSYEIWYKNGRNDVYVYHDGVEYSYKYYEKENEIILLEV